MNEHDFDAMRRAMVSSQLRTTGVSDARVIAAMGEVPRERFAAADQVGLAYLDAPLPIANDRASPSPMVTGRLLTEARIGSADRVLIVGSGTGYAAEVASHLARQVTALEEDGAIAGDAATSPKVRTVAGPLVEGWAAGAPYDVILFDGAIEHVPPAIVDQLAEGGRLAAPLIQNGVVRLAIGRKASGAFGIASFADAGAPRLPGFAIPPAFSF